ncbi:MAG: HlyD family type I secretion periplasmic adaptor subunit [Magnetococcales bacterium]|nr:HlyD family type I secretion periplasmic adaptor subunit [Magnetococcales bacterium]
MTTPDPKEKTAAKADGRAAPRSLVVAIGRPAKKEKVADGPVSAQNAPRRLDAPVASGSPSNSAARKSAPTPDAASFVHTPAIPPAPIASSAPGAPVSVVVPASAPVAPAPARAASAPVAPVSPVVPTPVVPASVASQSEAVLAVSSGVAASRAFDSSALPPPVDPDVLKPEKKVAQTMKQGNKQRRYLAQSVVLEESGLSSLVRLSLAFTAGMMILFLVWASFSRMEEMAPTVGEVMPAGAVQHIQHLEGGIVKAILVKEGELVEAGKVLFQMAPESALAELNQMRARHAALEAQIARNRAFLEEKEPAFDTIPAEFSHLIRDQLQLLTAQRAFRESRRDVLRLKMDQRRLRITNLTAQRDSLEQQLRYFDEEVAMRRAGLAKGVMSRLAALGSERDRSRVAGDLERTRGDLVTAQKELDEAVKQLTSLNDEVRQESLKELGAITSEVSQLREGMLRQQNRVERLDVRAPVKGVIKNLQMETLRGVVPPGGLLTEIVPVESTRRVETRINTRDVGHVKPGQAVTVKVTTYDFSRYGGIDGVLESISATTFKDPSDPTPYYKGIIRLERAYVGGDPKRNEVLPGMAVQADIHTGSKTLMEYMLKPIYASMDKAFRER